MYTEIITNSGYMYSEIITNSGYMYSEIVTVHCQPSTIDHGASAIEE